MLAMTDSVSTELVSDCCQLIELSVHCPWAVLVNHIGATSSTLP